MITFENIIVKFNRLEERIKITVETIEQINTTGNPIIHQKMKKIGRSNNEYWKKMYKYYCNLFKRKICKT